MADGGKTSSLSWVELPGAEACGGASALARQVEDRLGRHALVSPSQADLSIEGHVERAIDPPRWRAVIHLRDDAGGTLGSRELESTADSCDDLRVQAALAIALMIDPDAVHHAAAPTAPPPPPSAPSPPVSATPSPLVRTEVEAHTSPPSSLQPGWRVQPSAAAALGFGLLPSLTVGARVAIVVAPPKLWGVELFGGAWAPQTVAIDGGSAQFKLGYAGLALCPLHIENGRRVIFDVCAGGEVGVLDTTSDGPLAGDQAQTSVDAVAEGQVSFPVAGAVRVHIGARFGVALERDRAFYTDAAGDRHVVFEGGLATAVWDVGIATLFR